MAGESAGGSGGDVGGGDSGAGESIKSNGIPQKSTENKQNAQKSMQSDGKAQEPSVKDVAKKAVENARKKYKVYGEEVEHNPDRSDEMIQKGYAFEKKSGKLSEMEKKVGQWEEAVQKGDRAAIKKLLGDERFHQFAVEHINELIEQEEMSPQERANRERENKLMERERKIQEEEQRREQEENDRLDEHYSRKFDVELSEALTSSGLPKHPKVMGRMAVLMQQNLDMGLELPAASIAKLVKSELEGEVKSLLGVLDGNQLSSILGDEVAQRLRTHSISQLRDPNSGNRVAGPVKPKTEETKGRQLFGSPEESRPTKESWKDRLAKIKAEG